MPVAVVINGIRYVVHSDHLNTPRKLTNASGQTVWQWPYSAFGDELPTTAENGFMAPGTGAVIDAPVTFNLRYPGQYYDKESGLHYNYFRSYDPRTGRYTQPDPIGLDGGWNRFGYADQNPLSFGDLKGLQPVPRGTYLPRGPAISGSPAMAENGGIGNPRSLMNQFTNEPNPALELPGGYVGINYPWKMPNLLKVCDGPYPEPDPNAGNTCRPSQPGLQGPFLSPMGRPPARACTSWRLVEIPE